MVALGEDAAGMRIALITREVVCQHQDDVGVRDAVRSDEVVHGKSICSVTVVKPISGGRHNHGPVVRSRRGLRRRSSRRRRRRGRRRRSRSTRIIRKQDEEGYKKKPERLRPHGAVQSSNFRPLHAPRARITHPLSLGCLFLLSPFSLFLNTCGVLYNTST